MRPGIGRARGRLRAKHGAFGRVGVDGQIGQPQQHFLFVLQLAPKRCMAAPSPRRVTFLNASTALASAPSSAPSAASRLGAEGLMTSSISRLAAGISASSPLSARFINIPGISSRLISLVPSKIRFTRASR